MREIYDNKQHPLLIQCRTVMTIGIILDGSVTHTKNQETTICKQNETFAIFPYVPHSISTHDSDTLLSLCIDKNIINSVNVTTIQKHITLLLMQVLNIEKINIRYYSY